MKNNRFPLWAFVCLLPFAFALAAPPPAPAAGPVPPEEMKGLTFDGLTDDQKKLAISLLNDNGCDCGCGMKIAVCRRDDAKCPRSQPLGTQVIDLVKQGKSRDEVLKIALSPPSKFVQFKLTAGNDPAIGPKNAPVTIFHYYDYECPFCTKVGPALDQIVKDYPESVRIVFKQHPLEMHKNAMPAAEAALAAHAQGKFPEMHKKLFENQRQLTREKFVAIATEIGLNVEKFTKDLDDHTYRAAIQKDVSEVEGIGASGTPASFINGRFLNGAKPFGAFKEIIDEEIGWAKSGKRPEFKIAKNVSEASTRGASAAGPDPNKVYPIAAGSAPFKGSAKAKVTILHYFDYQCPFCVKLGPTFEQIVKDYPEDVRVVFKMHPLAMHKEAMPAAEAAMAAHAQGKFAEMHEKLFANSTSLSRDKYMALATEIGLDMKKFTSDLDTHAHKKTIDAETAEVVSIGATGTPASFVNGRFLSGAQPYTAFKKIIDEELAKEIAKATK